MLYQIIRKEMLLNLVSFRFIISVILLFVLIIGTMQIMASNYGRRVEDFSIGTEMHNDDLEKLNTRPQFEAFGVTKDTHPTLLGIFAIGLESQMSRSFMVPGYAMSIQEQGGRVFYAVSKLAGIQPEGSKYSNPIFTLFQPPDFIYIINIVLGLLAILFSFDSISGEKENQTLKLMLTNSVPRDVVLIGKWIGGTLSILLPFMLAFGIGVLGVIMRPSIQLDGDALVRLLLIFALSGLYIAVFFLVGMVFSVFTSRSSTSLVLSLFAWVIFVLVVPNLAPVISRQFVPMKPSDAIVREAERMENEMWHDLWKIRNDDQKAYRRKKKEITEKLPDKIRALEDAWLRRLMRQVSLAKNISRVSPSADYIYATTAIAGTGIDDYFNLRDRILRYRIRLGETRGDFVKDDTSQPIPMLYVKVDLDEVPVFQDKRIELVDSINHAVIDFGILACYLVILFMIAFVKFLNYDVK
ncbi:MAG TPA: ABC transporter permease subunit [bacterium]|nr:ABC transporter permease subunit [bacterium]